MKSLSLRTSHLDLLRTSHWRRSLFPCSIQRRIPTAPSQVRPLAPTGLALIPSLLVHSIPNNPLLLLPETAPSYAIRCFRSGTGRRPGGPRAPASFRRPQRRQKDSSGLNALPQKVQLIEPRRLSWRAHARFRGCGGRDGGRGKEARNGWM